MILGDPDLAADPAAADASGITIDYLLRRAAARHPDAAALVDAPGRAATTPARRLDYAAADRIVSAIAARLRQLNLPTDTVVGLQLPHGIEQIVTLLGILRAGLIAAPLPLLWRRADIVTALARVGAKALITCGRIGDCDHGLLATRVAAELFSIRYVCGFGDDLPDGVMPLDDLLTAEAIDPLPPVERSGNAAAHLAVITFDTTEDGPVPVARRHLEFLAGGLGVLLEGRIGQKAGILSTLAPSSFAGICLTLVPWLLAGGKLVLHPPFAPDLFARQRREEDCSVLVVPAPVAFAPGAYALLAGAEPATVLAAWHAPEALGSSPRWAAAEAPLVDVAIFGEAGLVVGRRGGDGRPLPLPLGQMTAPRGGDGSLVLAEIGVTPADTLMLRGSMVPRHAFPPGIERSAQPYFKIEADGAVDTGYRCRLDASGNSVTLSAAPAGLITVGGCRLPLRSLQLVVARIDAGATLATELDPLMGQRLVGTATDPQALRSILAGLGLNPLIARAFGDMACGDSAVAAAEEVPQQAVA